MRPLALALVLAVAFVAAGCIAPGATDPPTETAPAAVLPFPDPMGHDHDHSDPTIHAFSHGFEQAFHHPLAGSATHSAGVHALDAKGGYLFAAVYGGDADAEGGFFVFDIADPLAPVQVGRYQFPGQLGGDRSMEATEDANWVVLGTEAIDCAGHVNPVAPGLYLIDASDKGAMTPVHYLPMTMVHSVTIHRIDGVDYVFALTSGAIDQNVFRIVTSPVPRLEPVSFVSIGHDSIVQDDALLGKPLLYAANGDNFVVTDVSDPANPAQLAEWTPPDRGEDGDMYYLHTVVAGMIGDRRIVVVTSEDWLDYPSAMWILDATDFGFLELLTQWQAPGDHAAQGLRYSMHNPRLQGDDLLLAYYHGGVWSLDLAQPESPRVQGLFMPGESTGYRGAKPATSAYADSACGDFAFEDSPFTFDVETTADAVYVADLHTGLYALKPTWGEALR